MRIVSTVKKGHISNEARVIVASELQKHEGQKIVIEIKKASHKTLKQYGYIYGAIYPIMQPALKELGQTMSIDDIDDMMKLKFWNIEFIDPDTGEILKVPNRKRKMNKEELSVFISDVIEWSRDILNIEKFPSREDFENEEIDYIIEKY